MTILYGIKNCDTVRTARRWLDDHEIAYRFHDLRADGVDAVLIATWTAAIGWAALVNRRGTTWKALTAADRTILAATDLDEAAASAILCAHPSLIKRPVLDHGGHIRVGFSAAAYQQFLAQQFFAPQSPKAIA